eukprot:685541-Rhodomonas_salina.2
MRKRKRGRERQGRGIRMGDEPAQIETHLRPATPPAPALLEAQSLVSHFGQNRRPDAQDGKGGVLRPLKVDKRPDTLQIGPHLLVERLLFVHPTCVHWQPMPHSHHLRTLAAAAINVSIAAVNCTAVSINGGKPSAEPVEKLAGDRVAVVTEDQNQGGAELSVG